MSGRRISIRSGKPRADARHIIADVHFTPGERGWRAPLECSCGAEMIVAEFTEHRRMNGLVAASGAVGPTSDVPFV
jgi:hypothetical protein